MEFARIMSGLHFTVFLAVCLFVIILSPTELAGESVKTGICPVAGNASSCPLSAAPCSNDASCPQRQKCCYNGCDFTCANPKQVAKAGRCPAFPIYGPTVCGYYRLLALLTQPASKISDLSAPAKPGTFVPPGRNPSPPVWQPIPSVNSVMPPLNPQYQRPCNDDHDCPGKQKCCNLVNCGAGLVCLSVGL